MKVDLIFIHSTTCISIAPITEYLKKYEHFFLHSVDFQQQKSVCIEVK